MPSRKLAGGTAKRQGTVRGAQRRVWLVELGRSIFRHFKTALIFGSFHQGKERNDRTITSFIYLLSLKIGFASRSRPEPLSRYSSGSLADRSRSYPRSNFLNTKINDAGRGMLDFRLFVTKQKFRIFESSKIWEDSLLLDVNNWTRSCNFATQLSFQSFQTEIFVFMKSLLTLLFLLPSWLLFSQSVYDLAPRELFFKQKDKVEIHLSKDGETVFFRKNIDGVDNLLYYIEAGAPTVERKKEFKGAILDYLPVYDNGIVAVIQGDTSKRVVFTSPKSKKIRELDVFPFERVSFMHLSTRFPNKVLVNISAKEDRKSGLYILDLLSSSMKRVGKMDGYQQMFFDQNFSKVAALRANDVGGNTILRHLEGQWIPVFDYPFNPEMFIGGLSRIVSVDVEGKTIYATDNFEKDKTVLVSIDVATGDVTQLASDADADMLPYAATLDPSGKPTAAVALWGDTKRYYFDEAVQKDFEFLNEELKNTVSHVESSADDKVWLVREMDGGPMKYYLFIREEQRLIDLFNDYSHLDGYDLGTRKAFTVTTRDSLKLPIHLYVPPGMAKADGTPRVPLPTIIYIHGGPWAGVTHWNNWFHTRNFQLLANRGYAVINMEFRGTTGLGKEVCDAGNLEWGAAMHNDIVDVVTWATRSGHANPKRVGLWGWSYGGYATNYALGAAPDLFSCGVSMYGIADLYEFCKLPFADNDLWRTRVGDHNTEEGAALLRAHSPTTHINSYRSPLLLTTGSKDERVPQSQSDQFAQALDEAGKKVVYFYYPDEVHDYRQPESWISFWAIAEDFLQKNVGGRKEPRKDDIEKGNFITVYGAGYIEEIE